MRLTGSVVQPMSCYDLLTYKAIGSNYLSFVVTSMLVSTSPLDEAGTATACMPNIGAFETACSLELFFVSVMCEYFLYGLSLV